MEDTAMDRSGVSAYDSGTQHQYLELARHNVSPKEKLPGHEMSAADCFFFFFSNFGVVHHKFIPVGQMVYSASYVKVTKWLRDAIGGKMEKQQESVTCQ
jgi:hypothetical protein